LVCQSPQQDRHRMVLLVAFVLYPHPATVIGPALVQDTLYPDPVHCGFESTQTVPEYSHGTLPLDTCHTCSHGLQKAIMFSELLPAVAHTEKGLISRVATRR
jgi:hypothetical protein